ncbi:hypothetical protein HDU76_014129 [Blyttiomyces sp. JEL0837]|nr:hypothetical protein HDU76_014129 [Blyttiomyces sp. JEL0837]
MEEEVLIVVCFDMIIELPHTYVIELLDKGIVNANKYMDFAKDPASLKHVNAIHMYIRHHAKRFADDCLSTTLPLRYAPDQLAFVILGLAINAATLGYRQKIMKETGGDLSPQLMAFCERPLLTYFGRSIFEENPFYEVDERGEVTMLREVLIPDAGKSRELGYEITIVGDREKICKFAQKTYGKMRMGGVNKSGSTPSLGATSPPMIMPPQQSPNLVHYQKPVQGSGFGYAPNMVGLPTPSPMNQMSPSETQSANSASITPVRPGLPSPDVEQKPGMGAGSSGYPHPHPAAAASAPLSSSAYPPYHQQQHNYQQQQAYHYQQHQHEQQQQQQYHQHQQPSHNSSYASDSDRWNNVRQRPYQQPSSSYPHQSQSYDRYKMREPYYGGSGVGGGPQRHQPYSRPSGGGYGDRERDRDRGYGGGYGYSRSGSSSSSSSSQQQPVQH